MPQPLVSIVIPMHDAAQTIESAIATCCRQTYPALEIIVVDDHSADDCRERARRAAARYGRSLVEVRSPERGAGAARNAGFACAGGEFIAFVDADDGIHPDKVARQVAAAADRRDVLVTSDYLHREQRPGHQPLILPVPIGYGEDRLTDLLTGVAWTPPACWLVGREAAQRLAAHGGFRNGVRSEIREYIARAALLDVDIVHVPEALAFYRTWSPSKQLSLDAPRHSWAGDFATSFRALRALADERSFPLTEDQRFVLAQPWTVHRWKRLRAEPGDTSPLLLSAPGMATVAVTMAEAALFDATGQSREAFTLESLVHAAVAARPYLARHHVRLLRAAVRLRSAGCFEDAPG